MPRTKTEDVRTTINQATESAKRAKQVATEHQCLGPCLFGTGVLAAHVRLGSPVPEFLFQLPLKVGDVIEAYSLEEERATL